MSSRKLTKKDFEKMLNEEAQILIECDNVKLSGMDDYFESWKFEASKLGYGTWLRKKRTQEFDYRYSAWVDTNA